MTGTPAYLKYGTLIKPNWYHFIFITYIAGVVLAGTLFSIYYGTHHYSVAMSAIKHTNATEYHRLALNAPIFVDRSNWINQTFVKLAWFWNTLVVVAIAATLKRTAGGLRGERQRTKSFSDVDIVTRILASKTFLRWAVATLGWVLFAAWFFGPSVTQRVSIATGAQCVFNGDIVDAAQCHLGTNPVARWSGGHDVSGHTFILALGILLILEMLVPYLPYVLPSFSLVRQSIPLSIYADKDIFRTGSRRVRLANVAVFWGSTFILGLWGIMLTITAVYHHHPNEKLTGMLCALLVWFFMPKEHALH
ncbi:ATP adenylyltransferase [Malassezia cuniculi]|uniref:ATP adenylyltransferase n=1 Tax=Malassezia cuniculi TaxID=948313 RepID=A0AAF0J680_9BASI|nr:ATP adenylyltransferase [Malassezia cuniculi]